MNNSNTPTKTPNKLSQIERITMAEIYEYHRARRATGTTTQQEARHQIAKSVFQTEQQKRKN
jgi:hypothetical protein